MNTKFLKIFSLFIFFFSSGLCLPRVEIVGTGGTIAGAAASSIDGIYKAGSLTIQQISDSVPGLNKIADLGFYQFSNIDSVDMNGELRIKLAKKIQKIVDRKDVDGVVITHGTDSMAQTAFFLNQEVKTMKPIVLVGAMRSATSISSDGPMNLYEAVAIASDKSSWGRGVLVAMNDTIFPANDVTKMNTISVDAFQATNYGALGTVNYGNVKYYENANKAHAEGIGANLDKVTSLPSVEIIYESEDISPEFLNNLLNQKNLKGIVIAGMGDGNIPSSQLSFLEKARKKGIVIVRSSYVRSGRVTHDYNNLDTKYGLVSSETLRPEIAKIYLQLCLLKTDNIKDIQKLFNKF